MHVTRHAQHARIYTHHPADAKPCKYGSNSRGITSAGIVSGDFGNQGVGAEMQERLCAFAFARKINTAYVHLPLYALTHMSRTPELPEKLEEFFGLRKLASWTVAASRAGIVAQSCATRPPIQAFPCVRARQLSRYGVQHHQPTCANETHRQAAVAVGFCPFCATCQTRIDDLQPVLQASASFGSLPLWMVGTRNIALHVRRGDAKFRGVVPMAYFVAHATQQEALHHAHGDVAKPIALHVLTDSPHKAEFEWCTLKPNCRLHIGMDLLDTLRTLVLADVLVCSNSALSYVAGIYSRGEVHWPGKPYLPNPPLPTSWHVHPMKL
jgi:hypothetical protein